MDLYSLSSLKKISTEKTAPNVQKNIKGSIQIGSLFTEQFSRTHSHTASCPLSARNQTLEIFLPGTDFSRCCGGIGPIYMSVRGCLLLSYVQKRKPCDCHGCLHFLGLHRFSKSYITRDNQVFMRRRAGKLHN